MEFLLRNKLKGEYLPSFKINSDFELAETVRNNAAEFGRCCNCSQAKMSHEQNKTSEVLQITIENSK
ncbi:CLUMA_CG010694, isoform A [Clunio marinus]|uniref:CLUMA_CG010694, isoform A n=1 Tax=Clunio marinus TaxID=568069 RepID=A0A1J1IAR2_9DIPT|nr:CLUMA_CG010694, isoform A [Clunio marinus]